MGTFVSGSCGLDCEVGERTVAGQQEQRPLRAGAGAVEFGEWVTRGRRPRSLRMVSVARRKGRASLISGSGPGSACMVSSRMRVHVQALGKVCRFFNSSRSIGNTSAIVFMTDLPGSKQHLSAGCVDLLCRAATN